MKHIQRILGIMFLIGGWLIAGVTNGSLNRPLNHTGAFASALCVLVSIAISVIK